MVSPGLARNETVRSSRSCNVGMGSVGKTMNSPESCSDILHLLRREECCPHFSGGRYCRVSNGPNLCSRWFKVGLDTRRLQMLQYNPQKFRNKSRGLRQLWHKCGVSFIGLDPQFVYLMMHPISTSAKNQKEWGFRSCWQIMNGNTNGAAKKLPGVSEIYPTFQDTKNA